MEIILNYVIKLYKYEFIWEQNNINKVAIL